VRALLVADAIEKKFVRAAGRPVLSFVPGSRTGGAFNPNEGVSVAFDPKTLSPEAQALYRKIGKRFDSGRTLSQAEKTRNGANKIIGLHAEALARRGVRASTITRLEEVRQALLAATEGREHTRTGKKVTNVAHLDAISDGKNTRLELQSALGIARTQLFETGDKASVNEIDVALDSTSVVGDDSDVLINQLKVLVKPLTNAAIRQVVADGDETIPAALEAEVAARIASLDTAREQKAAPAGTPIDTGFIDVMDGMLVVICRDIRRAVRALARQLGKPELNDEVELKELYARTKRAKNRGGGGGGPTAG